MASQKNSLASSEIPKKLIDIEHVISSKNPILLKFIPRLFLNYLRKLLHESRLNKDVFVNMDKHGAEFTEAILERFGVKINIIGEENIPQSGNPVIVSNHPLGGLDGMALISVVGKYRSDIKFIVNDLLLIVENLNQVFIPVNKVGNSPREALKLVDEMYKSSNLVINFPFGLVSRKRKGQIEDLEWKKSFLTKSIQYKRNIVPVHIEGKNSNFFYSLANLRKFFRIKTNIEMFFLVNEMYKQKDKNINITFGKPISIDKFDTRYTETEWAEKLRQYVYKLAINPQLNFDIK